MYFPYLRGKQFELIALREYLINNYSNNKIVPLIEPVKDNLAQLTKTLNSFEEKNQTILLILNPQVGSLKVNINSLSISLRELLSNYHYVNPAFIVDKVTDRGFIESIINDFEKISLIHNDTIMDSLIYPILRNNPSIRSNLFKTDSRSYRRKISPNNKSILLEDHFPMEEKNADYPEDNYFSDEIYYYQDDGFYGFSDFSIIGDSYREEGGPAYAVTIHLIYEKNNEELRIRHFVSDETGSPTNPGGKFLEALNKLIKWMNTNPSYLFESNGVKELKKLHNNEHYPGLGCLKKISLIHHFELCNFILNK